MKPFNLEEAIAGKPVITRDGEDVKELHYFKNCNELFVNSGGSVNRYSNQSDISRYFGTGEDSYRDLFMAPIAKTGYIVIIRSASSRDFVLCGKIYASEAAAVGDCNFNYPYKFVKVLPITYEE